MRTPYLVLAAAAALGACVEADGIAPDSLLPDADPGTPDGTRGWARVKTLGGTELLPYVAFRGHAFYQGDIDLGPIMNVDARLYGAAVPSTGARWPGGQVDFAFHAGFTGVARQSALAAVAELEQVLPIDFHEVAAGGAAGAAGAWIELKWAPGDAPFDAASTAVGMVGAGQIHCSPYDGCRSDGGQWIYFRQGVSVDRADVKHQLLHALGVWHEQSRHDRDDYVQVHLGCVAPGHADQLAHLNLALDLGPYDFESVMHDGSFEHCVTDDATTGDPYLSGCACLPTTKGSDADGDGNPDRIWPGNDLSGEDVNGLWRHYNRSLGTSLSGDGLGRTLAVGDFDHDGYDDVAVGAPGDDVVATDTGAVYLFKGTSNRLVPWRVLTQLAVPGEDQTVGDGFGSALAAGDLDGDGTDDLVIGVPDENVGALADAGVVHVFRGGRGGPRHQVTYDQDDLGGTSAAGDRLGAAVAIGRLTGAGGVAELIVGAPGDEVVVAGGVGGGGVVRGGAVYVHHVAADGRGAARPTRLVLDGAAAGDRLGATLAVGRIDLDGNRDLAVGAPGARGGGMVAVFAGRQPPETDLRAWSPMARYVQLLPRPAGGAADRFGAALLIDDVSGADSGEVVVGAPGARGAGRVYVYALADGSLAEPSPLALDQTLVPGAPSRAGDEFGAALAAYERDGTTLVVGSPGENDGAGLVTLYQGTYGDLVLDRYQYQAGTDAEWDRGEPGDRFGAALAVGSLDRLGDGGSTDDSLEGSTSDLVIGVPGEQIEPAFEQGPSGGAITVFLGGVSGTFASGSSYWQESAAVD